MASKGSLIVWKGQIHFKEFAKSPLEKAFDLWLLLQWLKIYNAYYFKQEDELLERNTNGG
jgi:hypothetical protein